MFIESSSMAVGLAHALLSSRKKENPCGILFLKQLQHSSHAKKVLVLGAPEVDTVRVFIHKCVERGLAKHKVATDVHLVTIESGHTERSGGSDDDVSDDRRLQLLGDSSETIVHDSPWVVGSHYSQGKQRERKKRSCGSFSSWN